MSVVWYILVSTDNWQIGTLVYTWSWTTAYKTKYTLLILCVYFEMYARWWNPFFFGRNVSYTGFNRRRRRIESRRLASNTWLEKESWSCNHRATWNSWVHVEWQNSMWMYALERRNENYCPEWWLNLKGHCIITIFFIAQL